MAEPNKPFAERVQEFDDLGEGAGLVGAILTASMDASFRTMDTLYEAERRRRQALEVRIEFFLEAAERASGGTTREYEKAIDVIRFPSANDEQLAALHHENTERF